MDKTAWDKFYFGIRNDIKLGIKHGLGAGAIIGDFLNNGADPQYGSIPQTTGGTKPYQARGGYSTGTSGKYSASNKYHYNSRQSCSRYHKSMRNRKCGPRFLRYRRGSRY